MANFDANKILQRRAIFQFMRDFLEDRREREVQCAASSLMLMQQGIDSAVQSLVAAAGVDQEGRPLPHRQS